jgi:flagellar hook-length control protein FliK
LQPGNPATEAVPDSTLPDDFAPSTAAGLSGKPLPPPGEGLPGAPVPDVTATGPAVPGPAAASGSPRLLPGTAVPEPEPPAQPGLEAESPDPARASTAGNLLTELAFSRSALRGNGQPASAALTAAADLAVPSAGAIDAGEPVTAGAASGFPPVMAPGGPVSTQAGLLANAARAAATAGAQRMTGEGFAQGSALAPLGDAGSFARGLGERLLSLGGDGLQTARLRLHPESLGPLEVRIQVASGQAEVWFGTRHGDARDAIEGTLPRLREMFAAQGLELGRVQVEVRPEPSPGNSPGWPGPGAAFANDRQPSGQSGSGPGDDAGIPAPRPWAEAAGRPLPRMGRSDRLVDVLA